jgi:hypothetical protein
MTFLRVEPSRRLALMEATSGPIAEQGPGRADPGATWLHPGGQGDRRAQHARAPGHADAVKPGHRTRLIYRVHRGPAKERASVYRSKRRVTLTGPACARDTVIIGMPTPT